MPHDVVWSKSLSRADVPTSVQPAKRPGTAWKQSTESRTNDGHDAARQRTTAAPHVL